MNLWRLFPEFIIHIPGILFLPYLALLFNGWLLYLFYKKKVQRKLLLIFMALSVIASAFAWLGLVNRTFEVIAPALLLVIALMPLGILFAKAIHKQKSHFYCWCIASLAGISHCLAWGVWMMAFMGS